MSWVPLDDPRIVFPHLTLQTVIGISVAIAGNVLISLALNLQKLAHQRLDHGRQSGLTNGEREGGLPGRDTSTRHIVRPDNTSRFSATQQASEENGHFEAQPLISHRSSSQSPLSSYGVAEYNVAVVGDDGGSRKSTNTARSRRCPRQRSFVSRFLLLQSLLGSGSSDSRNFRADSSVKDAFPQRSTRTADQGQGKAAQGKTKDQKESDYLRSKLWWSGFILMNIGETGNFISYGFAPASIVAPLGTFALVANCFFAPLLLNERFRPRDIFGILLAIIGATTVVLSTPSSDSPPPVLTSDALIAAITQRPFVIFSIVYLVLAIILCGLSEGSIGKRLVVVDVGLCALFGGFTVLATKAISTLLTKEWVNVIAEWITYPIIVLVVTGILQIRYLNRALKRFDSKTVIPTQFVFFTLSAVVGSAVLYGDFRRASFHEMFAGVFVIASGPGGKANESEHGEERHDAGGRREAASRMDGVGSLGAQSQSTQGMPRVSARDIPVLRHKQSTVSLVGYTPVQNMLLVHTPPRDRMPQWERV
ncbi:magnesium transporter NIPA-domain-containing protein [Chiua virens]|nr:magnesium transporter NIPA-domain-containing protein [Chiua virens]